MEDNPDVLHYTVSCLKDRFNIELATDGQEGLEKAIGSVPDIVLSDVMMPIMDGFELCKKIKADEHSSHIPVVMLTARADDTSRLKGLDHGVDAYLTKPFNREELHLVLNNLLKSRDALRQRYLNAGDDVPIKDSPEDAFFTRLNDVIEGNMGDEEFGVNDLCRLMKYSRSQLHNKVKALTGVSTSAYINQRRLQRGRRLLRDSELNIAEVAYEVGFRDPDYFARLFKREYSVGPRDYRQQLT